MSSFGISAEGAESPRPRPVVLVVDDDPLLQVLAREALEQGGFDVEPAPDCARALAAFERLRPDVILLDVNLPDGDGFSVCRAVRHLRGGLTLPVLMMTGGDDLAVLHRAYEVGATDFVTKPVHWALMQYRLRYILRAANAFERLAVSEAQLTRAQQIASLGHWELDLEAEAMRWSKEAARIFGLEPGLAPTPAERLWEVVHADDRERVRAALAALVAGRRPETLEFRIVRPDGEERTVSQRAEVVHDGSALPLVVATVQDVTERVRLETQFRQAQKMEAVGQLAGGIAHDFNNLLTVINGRCALLLNALSPADPMHADLRLVMQTGERAAKLTSQLLLFSRKQLLQRQVLDLNEVVNALGRLIERVLGEDIIKVLDLDEAIGRVSADRGQIEQILLNLAVNARDAMPRGGRLCIRTGTAECDEAFVARHPGARPGSYVTLAVEDTGEGMDAQVLARIFEPFFTTKAVGRGTGLGLSTVYGIVKRHDGYIAVDSEPGRGSRFTVYLERVDAEAETAQTFPGAPVAPALEKTILLVEDDDGVRDLAADILHAAGYVVLATGRGREALRIAETHAGPIHLLITDLVMPEMNGADLARRFSAIRPGTPTLFTSGYPSDTLNDVGFSDEKSHFLPKPFSPDALLDATRKLLDGDEATRAVGGIPPPRR